VCPTDYDVFSVFRGLPWIDQSANIFSYQMSGVHGRDCASGESAALQSQRPRSLSKSFDSGKMHARGIEFREALQADRAFKTRTQI
jgi:hypothetical protein